MPVKLRLQRKGRKKKPFYFIVVADSRAPRDGKFIQKIGTYNPLTVPATVQMDRNRALHWLEKGAQPTDTVRRLLSFKGVLYLKHLKRGVKLGLFDDQTANEKFEKWLKEHEDKVLKKRESHQAEKLKDQKPAPAPVQSETEEKESGTEENATEKNETAEKEAQAENVEKPAAPQAEETEKEEPKAEEPAIKEAPKEDKAKEEAEEKKAEKE